MWCCVWCHCCWEGQVHSEIKSLFGVSPQKSWVVYSPNWSIHQLSTRTWFTRKKRRNTISEHRRTTSLIPTNPNGFHFNFHKSSINIKATNPPVPKSSQGSGSKGKKESSLSIAGVGTLSDSPGDSESISASQRCLGGLKITVFSLLCHFLPETARNHSRLCVSR